LVASFHAILRLGSSRTSACARRVEKVSFSCFERRAAHAKLVTNGQPTTPTINRAQTGGRPARKLV
jgi:hypothetical protein